MGACKALLQRCRPALCGGLTRRQPMQTRPCQGRQRVFGANKFKEVQQKAFFQLVFENLQDPILILLIVAALVSSCMT